MYRKSTLWLIIIIIIPIQMAMHCGYRLHLQTPSCGIEVRFVAFKSPLKETVVCTNALCFD